MKHELFPVWVWDLGSPLKSLALHEALLVITSPYAVAQRKISEIQASGIRVVHLME
jgi:hypothetical protein